MKNVTFYDLRPGDVLICEHDTLLIVSYTRSKKNFPFLNVVSSNGVYGGFYDWKFFYEPDLTVYQYLEERNKYGIADTPGKLIALIRAKK